MSLSGSCLRFFKEQLPPQQFNSWIKPLVFEIDGDKLILTAPN
ncbi:MAG: DnaA N-terminal domain-containing protein, partial [Gallionellaceae bacterium]|nr:DnaA N-terminal domain-containing protein [Gallionellaceae bacterium]